MLIRDADRSDLEAIGGIYNHEVRTSVSTFDTEPRDADALSAWFDSHRNPAHPLLVAEQDGEIVGWGSLSPWSERGAYVRTVEGSLFIKDGHRHSGVGLELSRALLDRARRAGHRVVIGRIEASNEASRQLMLRLGFRSVGVMRQVGEKFGRALDVEVLELAVGGAPADGAEDRALERPSPSLITLRPFRPADADTCFRIRADAYVHEFFAELGAEAAVAAIGAFLPGDYVNMAREGAVCVAENSSAESESWEGDRAGSACEVVGFCVARRVEEATGEVFLIYIRRDFHHQGIGRLLLRWAEAWLKEELPRLERIIIDTVIPGYNQRFYERMGYEVLSRQPHEFPGRTLEAVRLVKRVGR